MVKNLEHLCAMQGCMVKQHNCFASETANTYEAVPSETQVGRATSKQAPKPIIEMDEQRHALMCDRDDITLIHDRELRK